MSLAENWYIEQYENVSIISPDTMQSKDYNLGIYEVIKIFKANDITVPAHTVLIFPVGYSNGECPVSYINQNLIMIFPFENNFYKKSEYVMYQYLHELGHLITGNFEQSDTWIGELLACSCNFFFYPKDNINNSFYDESIAKKTLSFHHNKLHYDLISKDLEFNQYLVYNGDNPIQSALYAYGCQNSEFNFASLLNDFYTYRNDTEMRKNLIFKVKCIFSN